MNPNFYSPPGGQPNNFYPPNQPHGQQQFGILNFFYLFIFYKSLKVI
jgi:hypothetical protein